MVNLQDYITQSRLFRTIPVDDSLVVEYKCLVNDHKADIWTHDHYFAFVVGGEKKWKTPDSECKVGPGELLFVRKGITTVYQYFEEPFLVLFIFVSESLIRETHLRFERSILPVASSHLTAQHLFPVSQDAALYQVFQSMLAYLGRKEAPVNEIWKLKIGELLLNIMTQPGNESLRSYLLHVGHTRKRSLEQTMKGCYHQDLAIRDYARLCGRSLSTFRREFQAVFGMPPGKWILLRRLDHGRVLLETTDKTIAEIVDESGFKNRTHFTRLFKDQFGTSPQKFREQIRVA